MTGQGPDGAALKDIVASARLPNIHIKLSGFHYATPDGWEYPHAASRYIVRAIYEHYGAERLSNSFPISARSQTAYTAMTISNKRTRTLYTFSAALHGGGLITTMAWP